MDLPYIRDRIQSEINSSLFTFEMPTISGEYVSILYTSYRGQLTALRLLQIHWYSFHCIGMTPVHVGFQSVHVINLQIMSISGEAKRC